MADMMTFPNTWEEFEQSYGITDTEEIYTNGARLIPSFRVEQWLDHIAQPMEDKLKKIADALSEKMSYMNTCPNERDIILGYLGVKRSNTNHCNTDCWNEKCESYHYETRKQLEPCDLCSNLEKGDTLYQHSDWDGGIGFDYIWNIQYCPKCGRRLEE